MGMLEGIRKLFRKGIRVVFMGTPEFAVPSLEALAESDHRIVAVVTGPDKRRGRGAEPTPTPVKKRALELGLRVVEVESTRDPGLARRLEELKPDLLVVVAFRVLPPEVLEIPRIGAVNLHASLLPAYRGAAPIHWAIINGEKETGCSVFFLEESVDTGDVIGQERVRIGPDENTGELYERLKRVGAELLVRSVDEIARGEAERIPQDESLASEAPKIFSEDARIDFTGDSEQVHNFIRGMNPHPGAWTLYGNLKMNVHRSKIGPDIDLQPGELIFAEGLYLLAGCGSGSVELAEVQLPGKNRISGRDFANGYNLDVRLG